MKIRIDLGSINFWVIAKKICITQTKKMRDDQ